MKHAQLWKRILNEGLRRLPGDTSDNLTEAIIKAPIIVDSRTCERPLYIGTASGLGFPFPKFWLEGMMIGGQQSGVWGSLVTANYKGERWYVLVCCVMEMSFMDIGKGIWFAGAYAFECDQRGNMDSATRRIVLPSQLLVDEQAKEDAAERIRCLSAFALDTMTMLGCQNVSLEPRDNDPKQVRRAVKRHGGTPDSYRYHVLVVRPPGAKSNAPAQEIGIMPRHVCRGHFAEYGPEFGKGLLFGKYSGRFYVPPCVKGKKENGTVEKDYEIR